MKAWILLILAYLKLTNPLLAQEERPKISHISKGETFFSLETQNTDKYKINDSFYKTFALKLGGGYYFVKRLAVKASVVGQHYMAQELVTPTQMEFNKKDLLLLTGQLRYNFWEQKGFVSTFVQTGYALGQFANADQIQVKRWEVLTIGETLYIPFDNSPRLSFDLAVGFEKDNLNQKKAFPFLLGFNYYIGKTHQKI